MAAKASAQHMVSALWGAIFVFQILQAGFNQRGFMLPLDLGLLPGLPKASLVYP